MIREIPEEFLKKQKKLCIVLNHRREILMIQVSDGYTVFLLTEDNILSWKNLLENVIYKMNEKGRELWVAKVNSIPPSRGFAFAPLSDITAGVGAVSDRNEKEEALLLLLLSL